MRMALATVSGLSTGAPWTSGAAPAAWKPSMRGDSPASRKPFQYAVMLPALPTGMHNASSGRSEPSSSSTSNAAVFWPSRRNGLTLLTSAIGWRPDTSPTSSRARPQLPRRATRMAPAQLADQLERLVEVAAQCHDAGAVHQRLGELAGRDLALGDVHRARQA